MKKIFYRFSVAILSVMMLTGCEDFFDPDTNDTLLEGDYIGSWTELYSGYMGIGWSVKESLDKIIFLEGLRGELLEPTVHAPQDFWDLYNYTDAKGQSLRGNELADPKEFYAVILNANDFIKHAIDYNEANPGAIDAISFKGLIGGAIRYKAWAYLTLAKLYGEAIYIDDPLVQYQEIANYPVWGFDQIIDKCIDLIHNGMYGINGLQEFNWMALLDPATSSASAMASQDFSRNRETPMADALLAELQLWKGNYTEVRRHVFNVINSGFSRYDSNYAQNDFTVNQANRGANWAKMFSQYLGAEHVAGMTFDFTLQQNNKLLEYFSNMGRNKYYMRPSKYAMDKFDTYDLYSGKTIVRGNGITFVRDVPPRWGNTSRPSDYNGEPVFLKHIWTNTGDQLNRTVRYISMYRAKELFLFLIEANIQLLRFEEALMLWNAENTYSGTGPTSAGEIGRMVDPNTGQFRVGSLFEGYPVQLAGTRYSNAAGYVTLGIRAHVGYEFGTADKDQRLGASVLNNPSPDPMTDKRYLDSLLIEEVFYEQSGEGRALSSMIRIAKRWDDSMRRNMAAKIASKYNDGAGDVVVQQALGSSIDNWFIKYPLNNQD